MNIFLLFGITGDLAKKKVIPALAHIVQEQVAVAPHAESDYFFIGIGRKPLPPAEFTQLKYSQYVSGDIEGVRSAKTYKLVSLHIKSAIKNNSAMRTVAMTAPTTVADKISLIKKSSKVSGGGVSYEQKIHTIYVYSSLPPDMHAKVIESLARYIDIPLKLCKVVIIVEKPIGHDVTSAEQVVEKIKAAHQSLTGVEYPQAEFLFLVDHYLNKEAIQQIKALSVVNSELFAHTIGSPNLIEMRVLLYELQDIAGRGAFYDQVGALFDVGQNHLLQILSSVALLRYQIVERNEQIKKGLGTAAKSRSFITDSFGVAPTLTKSEFLNALGLNGAPLFGQYREYQQAEGVTKDSLTETYFDISLKALKTKLTKNEWKVFKNIKFSISAGKKMGIKYSGIELYYANGHSDFIDLNKVMQDAYVHMFRSAMKGDQSQFAQIDEIKAGWMLAIRAKKMKTRSGLIVYENVHDILGRI